MLPYASHVTGASERGAVEVPRGTVVGSGQNKLELRKFGG